MATRANDILQQYIQGSLSGQERCAALLPHDRECSELLVSCRPEDYSASAIARAVEDCDCRVLALSVTAMRDADDRPVVMLKVDSRTPDSVARSLTRYGYETLHFHGDITPGEQAEAMARVNELLHYLEI